MKQEKNRTVYSKPRKIITTTTRNKSKTIITIIIIIIISYWEDDGEYVWGVGRRAEWKAWKELSVGTGIEPQRNPTGFGVAISNVPTHRSSREFSEFDDDDDDDDDNFAMGTTRSQTTNYLCTKTIANRKMENPKDKTLESWKGCYAGDFFNIRWKCVECPVPRQSLWHRVHVILRSESGCFYFYNGLVSKK